MTEKAPAAPTLSRRERLSLLCEHNAAYLQFQAENVLDKAGWALATGLLAVIKKGTGGEIGRKNLHDLPRWLLYAYFTDESFDQAHATLLRWLGDL